VAGRAITPSATLLRATVRDGVRAEDVLWFGGMQDTPVAEHKPDTADAHGVAADFGGSSNVDSSDSGSSSSSSDEHLLPAQLVDMYLGAVGDDTQALFSGPDEAADDAVLDVLDGCEPNIIRSADDMYTPRWIRGIGREKEGLCPVCFDGGMLIWRRMKCSAY
ncbi:hypothetical protein H4R19_005924, partial [Coemansia spiralis]